MIAIAGLTYLLGAIFVGLLGTTRRLGFLGFFFLSLVFSPPLVLVILLLTRPVPTDRSRRLVR
jgi:hypothetical protein